MRSRAHDRACFVRRRCCMAAYAAMVGLMFMPLYRVQAAKPKAFPEVALSAGSQPRYAALALDPWKSRVAYLLFDGNLAAGYARVYAWIPDDARYGRPVVLTRAEGSSFGPLDLRVEYEDEVSRVAWMVATTKRTVGGGTHSRVNYATGKTTTVTSEQRDVVGFSGTANLAFGNRFDIVGQSDFPLDIMVNRNLAVVTEWNKLGAPVAPWENLSYSVQPRAQAVGEDARIVLTGTLNATIRSLPEEALVDVKVRPYLEDPIASTSYAAEDLSRGVAVSAPYGWYTVSWNFECAPLSGRLTGTTRVFPVSKPGAP